MDNSLTAPQIRQMFLDFFIQKVGMADGEGLAWLAAWVDVSFDKLYAVEPTIGGKC